MRVRKIYRMRYPSVRCTHPKTTDGKISRKDFYEVMRGTVELEDFTHAENLV